MTKEEFGHLYDRFAKPLIEEVCENNAFVKSKDYDKCKNQVYDEYEKIRDRYKECIFSKGEYELLDRHKVAACICGAIIKCSVIDKTQLIRMIQKDKTRIETYFYYVNEFIAFVFATKVLMAFMMKDCSSDFEKKKDIYSSFPILPKSSHSKVSVLYSTLFNLAQVTDSNQIGIDHYDMYSYAMFFFFLESYYYKVREKD